MHLMAMTPKFWRWITPFAGVGLFVPSVITVGWLIFHPNFGDWLTLWPSSVMFMALDKAPTSTVVFIYAIAFVENVFLYAAIGVVTWPFAYLVLRLYSSYRSISKSD